MSEDPASPESNAAVVVGDVPIQVAAAAAFRAGAWASFRARAMASVFDGMILCLIAAALLGLAFLARPLLFSKWVDALVPQCALVFVVYHAMCTASPLMGTPGRWRAGTAVVKAETGERIGIGRAVCRAAVSAVSFALVFPNLAMAFSPRRRSMADLLAGTVVGTYRPERESMAQARFRVLAFAAVIGLAFMVWFSWMVFEAKRLD